MLRSLGVWGVSVVALTFIMQIHEFPSNKPNTESEIEKTRLRI